MNYIKECLKFQEISILLFNYCDLDLRHKFTDFYISFIHPFIHLSNNKQRYTLTIAVKKLRNEFSIRLIPCIKMTLIQRVHRFPRSKINCFCKEMKKKNYIPIEIDK